jgi:RNA polymerase sigma-70 factor, ECF subfamily
MARIRTSSTAAIDEFRAEPSPADRTAAARRDETRLIAAARKGDAAAMNRLLELVSGPVHRFSRGFCRDPHDSEDLVQDVLLSLMRSLDTFRGDASLTTWSYIVARRACVRLRKRGARQVALDDAPAAADRPADRASEPPARDERRRLGEALERAIAELPLAQREVLVLRDVEGLPAAEVGKVLGLGERAVKSRLHRARLALRAQLAPFAGAEAAPAPGAHCPDTARLLSRYLEGELNPSVCARLEGHVSACPSCGAACDSLRFVLGACRDYGERKLPGDMRVAIRAAIRQVIRLESA